MQKKRILVVTQHFWPENFRINDIVEGFLADGLEVDVLCGLPNYPKGEWFPGYSGKGPWHENYKGANVYRCREISRKGNTGLRIFANYCSWPLFARFSLHRLPGGYDAILCYNTSPVLMNWPALAAGKKFKAPVSSYVLDIWPENLYSVLPVKNKLLRGIAQAVSDWNYRRADRLIAMSSGLRERLLQRTGKQPESVAVIPQYCEDFYAVSGGDPALSERYKGCFNLAFAGNFSPAQSLDTVLCALKLANERRQAGQKPLHLLLVGDGMSRPALEKLAGELCLEKSVTFYGSVPPEKIPAINGFADALLVSLSDSPDLGLTVPAKVASCMAAGKPLLASMNGEGARAVAESGGGLVSPACHAEALAENMLALAAMSEGERMAMGKKSKAYYEAYYCREKLLRQIETFIL